MLIKNRINKLISEEMTKDEKPENDDKERKGLIFNIQRFSIHDGPGIRTVIFFKGCPLRCLWCHNPEGQAQKKELVLWKERCMGCNNCLKVCPNSAVNNPAECSLCGKCVEECPAEAREIVGKDMTLEEVIEEILKDRVFYEQSKGGVTLSGGEPLLQQGFIIPLLKKIKKIGIHTAIETCGYATNEILFKASIYTDLFLFDIKLLDEKSHKKYTGVSNKPILQNLRTLSSIQKNIILRIPVIPGVNNNSENFDKTAELVLSLGLKEVHLLPFHPGGSEKYKRLGRAYKFEETNTLKKEDLKNFATILEEKGISVKIGG